MNRDSRNLNVNSPEANKSARRTSLRDSLCDVHKRPKAKKKKAPEALSQASSLEPQPENSYASSPKIRALRLDGSPIGIKRFWLAVHKNDGLEAHPLLALFCLHCKNRCDKHSPLKLGP
jgi:hypothetical protein